MLDHSSRDLSRAVLHTLAYADIFDYPLTGREIHHYLTAISAPLDAVVRTLQEQRLFTRTGDYYTLAGRVEIVSIRAEREARSRQLMPRALQYGRILGALPYVRMVALTGSLAVSNVSKNQDFDYMLVTAPGRVWMARAFALAFNRFTRLKGYTLCPNLLLSENALAWPVHDLYSARELCQMIPITGFDVYSKLMQMNQWVASFLPNAYMGSKSLLLENSQEHTPSGRPAFQRFLEILMRCKLGDRFEAWEMNRKVARFSRQQGFGEETIFNAEVCQGNFDHHGSWTRQALERRLTEFELAIAPAVPGGEIAGYQSPKTATGAHRS